MRAALTGLLLLGITMNVQAGMFVYVSMAPEEKIQVFEMNEKDGILRSVQSLKVNGTPGSLAVDPTKKVLLASLRSNSTLASFRIDPQNGTLQLLSTVSLPKGENAAFLSTDRAGRYVLSASYAAGKVVVHRLSKDGIIESPPIQTIVTAKTAHAIELSPDNRFAFVPHVTPNSIYQFQFDPTTGTLDSAGKASGGKSNSGPRHLKFHPELPFAYSSDEQGSSITAYRYQPKKGLLPVQTLSSLPEEYRAPNTTAEVKIHPTGKYVWISNRGHDSLAGFTISKEGKLNPIEQMKTEKTPRSFDVTPDGNYIFGAGEGSGKLATFQIDVRTGRLRHVRTLDVGKSLTWVMTLHLPKP